MGRDAAHGVKADRPAHHARMADAAKIGPGLVDDHRRVKGRARQIGGDGADARGRDAAARGHRLGCMAGSR
jgi:hypothetical protein